MNALKTKSDGSNESKTVDSSRDDANSYLKGMIEREQISYRNQMALYQKRRNSLTASSAPSDHWGISSQTTGNVEPSGSNKTKECKGTSAEADLTTFRSLKNLDEHQINMTCEKMHPDSISCDYHSLNELQRLPADLSKMCTSSSKRSVSGTSMTVQDLIMPLPTTGKSKEVVDSAALFYNNFYGI